MPPHSLTKFEIQRFYQNDPQFNVVYFKDLLIKRSKDVAYVINSINMLILEHIGLLFIMKLTK